MFKSIIQPLVKKLYKNLKNNTYKTAISSMRAFFKRNQDIDSLDDYNLIIERVMNHKSKNQTKIKQLYILGSIYSELQNNEGKKAIHKVYTKLNKDLNNLLKKNKYKNDKEKECITHNLKDLRTKLDYNNLDQKNILFSIYVSLDYTPRLELCNLIYLSSHKINKDHYNDSNYIFFNNNDNCFIVLNDYKTSDSYGPWIIPVEGKLKELIKKYIKSNKNNTDYIFLNSKKKPFPSNKFSEFFQKAFKEKLGNKITLNCLRKIKENDLFHQNNAILNMSVEEKEKFLVKYFRHSIKTAELFYKFVKDNDEEKINNSEPKSNGKLEKKDIWSYNLSNEASYYKKGFAKKSILNNTKKKPTSNNIKNFLDEVHQSMVKHKIPKSVLKILISSLSDE